MKENKDVLTMQGSSDIVGVTPWSWSLVLVIIKDFI